MAKDCLDLHGYRTEDVEAAVDRFLMALASTSLKRARIMTGKGTGKVQSVVVRYLKLAGYSWEYEKLANGRRNEGCLVIFL
jgi:dsDNA-specific endonuclease/ATPase MutS2